MGGYDSQPPTDRVAAIGVFGQMQFSGRALQASLGKRRVRASVLAALMAYPCVLVLISSHHGPGLSPDSINYVSTAQSLIEGRGANAFDGTPLTVFPPGLPLLLAALVLLGLDLPVAAVLLNMIAAALVVLLVYLLAFGVLSSRLAALVISLLLSISAAALQNFMMLWSEPMFTLATVATLLLLVRAVQRQRCSVSLVLGLTLSASFACTLRFIGITLIPVVFLGTVLANKRRSWGSRIGLGVSMAAVASIGLLAVIFRNLALGSEPFGARTPSGRSPLNILRDSASATGSFLYPSTRPLTSIATIIGVLLAMLLAFGLVRSLKHHRSSVLVVAAFSLAYWVALWYSQVMTSIDLIAVRLVMPVMPSMLIVAVFAIRELGSSLSAGSAKVTSLSAPLLPAMHYAAVCAIALVFVINIVAGMLLVRSAFAQGIGYNSIHARGSPLGGAIRALPAEGVAATEPYLAYWSSGGRAVYALPPADPTAPHQVRSALLSDVTAQIQSRKLTYLAYFAGSPAAVTPEELALRGVHLQLRGRYPDGDLYQVR